MDKDMQIELERLFKTKLNPAKGEDVAMIELIARFLRQVLNQVDKSIPDTITYHDPCQVGRNGGIYDDPRFVINQLADHFIELTPNRELNWCCGGGGGLVAMADHDFRMKSAKVRVEQVEAAHADRICTICENCHTQLTDLNEDYGMGMKLESLTNLTAHALHRQLT